MTKEFAAKENFMFTLEQINEIHDRLGHAETLPQYLEPLRSIGVDYYDSFITDGIQSILARVIIQLSLPLCTRSSQLPRPAIEKVS